MKSRNRLFASILLAIIFSMAFSGTITYKPTNAFAAEKTWYGYCYDGSTYLAGVDITLQHVSTGTTYTTESNAQGYYQKIVGYSGEYRMMANDRGRIIVEYDTLPSTENSKRHDFDFTDMPF